MASAGRRWRSRRPRAAARAEDPSTQHILDAMGLAYCDLLRDRELLLCQLQAYAACGDPEIRARRG